MNLISNAGQSRTHAEELEPNSPRSGAEPGEASELGPVDVFARAAHSFFRSLIDDPSPVQFSTLRAQTPSMLETGSRGPEVVQLQQLLGKHGFDAGPADGDFGPRTEAAVRSFQAARNLEVDGIVGTKTWTALEAAPPEALPLLRSGDRGESVEILQERLAAHGFSPGMIDGDFGPKTVRTVRAFQAAHNLAVDGIVGTKTWTALVAEPGSENPTEPPQTISDAGLEFITGHEGFVPNVYDDPAGHCTIGIGHLVHRGPCDGSSSEAPFANGITQAQAQELLRQDAASAEAAVRRLIDLPLNQAQFDALVSFTFNVGEGAFEDSTLRKKLNSGDYASVPTELNRWVRSGGEVLPGLVRRRAEEGALFRDGYESSAAGTDGPADVSETADSIEIGAEGSDAALWAKGTANTDSLTSEITDTFDDIVDSWSQFAPGVTPVITSGNDSRHKVGSKHYRDLAIDLRANNVSDAVSEQLAAELSRRLGNDYDVIFERFPSNPANDHIHLEYDPD